MNAPVGPRRRAVLAGGASLSALPWLAACDGALREVAGGWVGAAMDRGHALRDGRLAKADAGSARRVDVAILGGGVAGLAAARALRRAGVDDHRLFELEDSAGGNARGHRLAGMRCPLGAHYLPLPGAHATEVSEWLHEIGLARSEAGRTVYDERHLCHAPQERAFVAADDGVPGAGQWQEGLLPGAGASAETLAQMRRFARHVRTLQAEAEFRMPTLRAAWSPGLAALDAQTFGAWLSAQGYDDARLLAYLDYCCRDDYGAGLGLVSAWAGIHYFASRHGFHAPGEEEAERDAVLTWPEGNAHLSERLANGVGARLQTASVITRIEPSREAVTIDVWNARAQQPERWLARQAIVCLPLFVAARLIDPLPPALAELAPRLTYAPWLVSNLLLREPLLERPGGAPPAWDNVIIGSAALGYVDAMHQSLRPVPGPTVLTHYWALGGQSMPELVAQRARLAGASWTAWRDAVLADLRPAHPDLASKLDRVDSMRYGHAMVLPTPGLRGSPALAALARPQGRLHFAHADLSANSVFEEAFTRGTLAGDRVASDMRADRAKA